VRSWRRSPSRHLPLPARRDEGSDGRRGRVHEPRRRARHDRLPGRRDHLLTIDGAAVDPAASYRISVNNFLADGGDGFTQLRNGTNRTGGGVDLDALVSHLDGTSASAPSRCRRWTASM
jgi:2',3'-cyclic-nucleotide 2'-phosphodiesterase (5'-nucleotidase family)